MNSTEKMILIPFSRYKRLTSNIDAQESELISNKKQNIEVNEKDVKVKKIIVNHDKTDKTDITDAIKTENDKVVTHKLSDTIILSHFSKAMQNKVKLLLQYIHENPKLLWSKEGEIIIDNKTIENSHIIDLIKYSLIPYKHFKPIASELFLKQLRNVPKSLLKNISINTDKQKNNDDIHMQKTEPPPGEPFIKKYDLI